ncbi:hypothetical protein LJR219_004509 [Phenylobacterium sp. LjRoot219]|uniref:tetratricopeptide repeat protein n=1 Tax=Phenylobacterium sp. LjRoot219 TaxID=3342283 RepID=UPI003ECE4A8D
MDPQTANDAAVELHNAGDLSGAERLLRQVLATYPENRTAAQYLGMTLMAQGRLQEGGRLYEARLADGRCPPLDYPRWAGGSLSGQRVLVWPEQGLGDQIMTARYAAMLKNQNCDVTLVCAPTLHRLFERCLPVRVLPAKGVIDFPDPDVWLMAMSLVAAIGDPAGAAAPYLHAEPRPAPFRIGVAARGNPTHANDAHRSLPPALAAELLAVPGAGSLLPEDTGAADMLDTAELIAGLDLVITVDTSICHLAGALGKPVWVLLPAHGVDWRWGREREDSAWYPSARLFRQPSPGDWRSVLTRVMAALPLR